MKKITVFIFCLITLHTQAQNTFPATGNVGIGTISPSLPLAVHGTPGAPATTGTVQANGTLRLRTNTVNSQTFDIGLYNVSPYGTWLQAANAGDLSSNSPLVLNPNGGNVGIGTSNPAAKLNVYNQGTSTQLLIGNPSSSAGGYTSAIIGTSADINGYCYITSIKSAGSVWGNLILNRDGGNVGIGTINPTQKLSVNGTIQAKEILVNTGWSDFVFDDNYKLHSLTEVEQFVKTNKHLPEIPSQKEVDKNGVQLGHISSKLLMKIEELTLYIIQQNKRIEQQAQQINALEKKLLENTK